MRVSKSPDRILRIILYKTRRIAGQHIPDGADRLIGAKHGINGWDTIDLVEAIERHYDVDLQPFFDARATERKGWFRTVKVVSDTTPRELAQEVASLLQRRAN